MKLTISHIARDRFYAKARRSLYEQISDLEARIDSMDLQSIGDLKLHLWMTDDSAYLRDDLSKEDGTTYATFAIVESIDFRPRARTAGTDLAILLNVADGVADAIEKAVAPASDKGRILAVVKAWSDEQRNAQQGVGGQPATPPRVGD